MPPRNGRKPNGPWYASGLRFECQPDCGRCCTRHDDFAYVYLDDADVRRLATHFELPLREFRRRFTFREEGHTALRIEGESCPFLDGSRCTVYEARPSQCRTFPFWGEHLKDETAWLALGSFCPGIGKGDPVPARDIRTLVRRRSEE